MIRVLVADDQAPIRRAFAALIDSDPEMQVVAEAATGREAVDRGRATLPHVVLMDVRMPMMNGIDATREICADAALRRTKILVLTTFDLDEYVYQALRAGASGFLLKDVEPSDLLQAVRAVAAGDALIAPRVTRRLITRFVAYPDDPAPPAHRLPAVTEREQDVIRLIARGLSNQEIGHRLEISPLTVKTHVSRILTKLDCRDRAQLVALAYESGLVVPGRPDTVEDPRTGPGVPAALPQAEDRKRRR